MVSCISLPQLQPAQRWVGLSFGDAHGAGVTDAGRVYTWGDNSARQLGQDATAVLVGAAAAAGQPAELAVLRGLDVKLLACGAQVGGSLHGTCMSQPSRHFGCSLPLWIQRRSACQRSAAFARSCG